MVNEESCSSGDNRIAGTPPGQTASASSPAVTPVAHSLIAVRDLTVAFPHGDERPRAVVQGLSYDLVEGQTLGVVGESGCGKTITSLALLGLIPRGAMVSGEIRFADKNILEQSGREWQNMRGRDIAMIFQEPMSAMNPVMKVGRQIAEVLVVHEKLSNKSADERAIALLDAVGIPSPRLRAQDYPHQLSGGMRQRAMIAMALACNPKLLVADEPTTALDVTIQAQILDLILQLQEENGMTVQFISHNLAVISEVAHRILVMYSGRGVENAPAERIFANPLHPYTKGLIATLPTPETKVSRLYEIPGSVRTIPTSGCRFSPRCPLASDVCRQAEPELLEVARDHFVACYKAAL